MTSGSITASLAAHDITINAQIFFALILKLCTAITSAGSVGLPLFKLSMFECSMTMVKMKGETSYSMHTVILIT